MSTDDPGCISTNLWIYFVLQTAVASGLSFGVNFGIAWATYHGGTNKTVTLWEMPAFGGDLLITVIIQTLITFSLLCYLCSLDRKNGPKWIFPCIKIYTQEVPSGKFETFFAWTRPYVYNDFHNGGWKDFVRAIGRAGIQVIIWEILVGIPATIITCAAFLPHYRFQPTLLAVGKGVYGFILAVLQSPPFVWYSLLDDGGEDGGEKGDKK